MLLNTSKTINKTEQRLFSDHDSWLGTGT